MADAETAYRAAVQNGAVSAQEPTLLTDAATGAQQTVAEVQLYGDVVLRLVSGPFQVAAEFVYSLIFACTSTGTCLLHASELVSIAGRLDNAACPVHLSLQQEQALYQADAISMQGLQHGA